MRDKKTTEGLEPEKLPQKIRWGSEVRWQLLSSAFGKLPLSAILTLLSALVILGLRWYLKEQLIITVWSIALIVISVASLLLCLVFKGRVPKTDRFNLWMVLFIIRAASAGAAWGFGPAMIVRQANQSDLLLFLAILVMVCGVVTISLAEEFLGMIAFLFFALAPTDLFAILSADPSVKIVSLLLFLGFTSTALVGYGSNKGHRRRLLSELQYQEAEARTRNVLEFLPDAVILHQRGQIRYVNRAALSVFRADSSQDLEGKSVFDFISEESLEKARSLFGLILLSQTNTPLPIVEIGYLRIDGKRFLGECHISPILYEEEIAALMLVSDITEWKHVDDSLRKMAFAVENSPVSIVITEPGGEISYVNAKFESVSGFQRTEVLGRNPSILGSGETPQSTLMDYEAAVAARQTWQGQFIDRRKDGGEYLTHSTVSPVFGENGELLCFIAINEDITERQCIFDELKRKEVLLREAQAISHVGNWRWDLVSGHVDCSDEIYRICGLESCGDIPAMEFFLGLVDEADRDEVQEAARRPSSDAGQRSVDFRLKLADGSLRWVHQESQQVIDDNGTLIALRGTLQDIHQRKSLEESLRLFQRIFESSGEAIGVADAEGKLVYLNPAYERLTQWEEDSVKGLQFSVLLTDEGKALIPTIVQTTLRGDTWTGLLPHQRKDGSGFPTHSRVGMVMTKKGIPQYRFNFMHDYSDELMWRDTLRQAVEDAEAASRAKSEFVSRMSHELRTPLNAILGFGQILAADAHLNEDQQDNVDEIIRAGRHLLALINEILDLAKIESGKIDISLGPVEVRALFEECCSLLGPLAKSSQITLVQKVNHRVEVIADRGRLKQVFLNLLSNALKYNRPGGQIIMNCTPSFDGKRRISISDTGTGIDQARMAELFKPFHRLGLKSDIIEGTGIGLAITKRFTELMNGQIGAESKLGQGSTFWIELLGHSVREI